MKKILKKIKHQIIKIYNRILFNEKKIIFCIGQNKTGTTSMEALFKKLNYKVGDQYQAELLFKDWQKNNFIPIIKYIKQSGNFFQDIPFSLPKTYEILEKEFPKSKFILTIRSEDLWVNSVFNFQKKIFANDKENYTIEDLKNADYIYKGYGWDVTKAKYPMINEENFNDKNIRISTYNKYNQDVINYFADKKNKLLVVDLSEPKAKEKIAKFIGRDLTNVEIPWANKT